MNDASPRHLYFLDILRGLASLVIVIFHYRHFLGKASDKISEKDILLSEPLYSILWPIYNYGAAAVYLFFVLSGFVFYFVYYEEIRRKSITIYKFFILRFSRLYPLHFVTLIFVAIVQLWYHSEFGDFVVFQMNDLKHFLLNLFLISEWGFQDGRSFNNPVWSVSIELILYTIFFLVTVIGWGRIITPVIMIAVGFWLANHGHDRIGLGLYSFFAGGIAFIAYEWERQKLKLLRLSLIAATIAVLSAIAVWIPVFAINVKLLILFGFCFPSLVLFLAAMQNVIPDSGRPFKFIGDITYATYLLHFPIQISAIALARYFGFIINFSETIYLLLYLTAVITLSLITYYFFERPAQVFLRNHFDR